MKPARLIACVALLCACGHDARRQNPFDPELTPAVALTAAVDDTAGTITLSWTRYEGRTDFDAYLVLRNEAERTRVDTLARLTSVGETSFVDSAAPNTAYEYQVAVRTAAGMEVPSAAATAGGYSIRAVELLDPETDARRVEIRLRWRRFRGARFVAYRVERRQVGVEDEFAVIRRVASVLDTAFADDTVQPEARYVYRIVVEAAGQDWVGNRSGREGLSLAQILVPRAVADPVAGVIRVSWPRYEGRGFLGYRVLRREPGLPDTALFESAGRADTSFADATARSGVEYAYTVAVVTEGRELVSEAVAGRLDLPAVELTGVVLSSASASAALTWSPYGGPRFAAYHVERRTAELAPRVVARVEDSEATAWVDTGLKGNTEYFYRVVMVTTLGEELASGERRGTIYPLAQTWPLDVVSGEYVRLYAEPNGRLAALVAGERRVRLVLSSPEGARQAERTLWESEEEEEEAIDPRSAATALLADGSRVLSLRLNRAGRLEDVVALLQFGAGGEAWMYERDLLADTVVTDGQDVVLGRVDISVGLGSLDEVTVTAAGQTVISDDFESAENPGWAGQSGERRDGQLAGRVLRLAKTGGPWASPLVSAIFAIRPGGSIAVRVGNFTDSWVQGWLFGDHATLSWRFDPDQGAQMRTVPALVLPNTPHALRVGVDGGRPVVSVTQPPLVVPVADPRSSLVSVAALESQVAVVDGARPYTLSPGQDPVSHFPLERDAGETRIWSTGEGRTWLGACLPDQHQVRFRRTAIDRRTGQLDWSLEFAGTSTRVLGTLVGQLPGSFLFPLSFDGAPDGRVYVLDAGNARVQVFDPDGGYLTQWGRAGSGPGEFDFGSGLTSRDLAGSLAVDSDGFIYVADVGNRRIQKFAP